VGECGLEGDNGQAVLFLQDPEGNEFCIVRGEAERAANP